MRTKWLCPLVLTTSVLAQQDQLGSIIALLPGPNASVFRPGFINATTGTWHGLPLLALPTSCSNGSWSTCANCTQGQTSTHFAANRTWFFLAREICDGREGKTKLLGTFDPTSYGASTVRTYATFDATYATRGDLSGWNIVWDHVCNIIVTAPAPAGSGARSVFMVSEYDGAVRPQTTQTPPPVGWSLVDGFAGIDFHNNPAGWPTKGNCGNDCALYRAEEGTPDRGWALGARAAAAPPRAIVGRQFHTGALLSNVSDPFRTRALTSTLSATPFSPPTEPVAFVGIGTCPPSSTDGHDELCGGHAGAMALLVFEGGSSAPYAVALLGSAPPSAEEADEAAALGVLVVSAAPEWERSPKLLVHVMGAQRAISTFNLEPPTNGAPRAGRREAKGWIATLNRTGTPLSADVRPLMWSARGWM